MKDGLKPCPFCGGEVRMQYTGSSDWEVSCRTCPVETKFWVSAQKHGYGEGERLEAMRRWNTRCGEAEEVERLRDENQRFRNGYANLSRALQNGPGLPLEGSSEEALAEWTGIIAGILMALGTLESTGKPQSPWEALLAIDNASTDTPHSGDHGEDGGKHG